MSEISGIVASRKSPGLFWVHNDSGDGARLYGIDAAGRTLGTVEIPRSAYDWEDIALVQRKNVPDQIYVADTGDNLRLRKAGVYIHRFEEPPRPRPQGALKLKANDVETMRLRFPGGPQDAEALLVDSESSEILLITKPHMEPPEIFGVSAFSEKATLSHLGTITSESSGLNLQLVTAADLSADGRHIILRTYSNIALFYRQPGQRLAEALLGRACSVKPAFESQGESIAFFEPGVPVPARMGHQTALPEFVTVGEGIAQPLYLYKADPGPGAQPLPSSTSK